MRCRGKYVRWKAIKEFITGEIRKVINRLKKGGGKYRGEGEG